ncbi:ABC transporter substrate-binding protein [Sphaerisporangium sp. NPDC005289]|uniref:ABC transporter substrate-binding protein n=1 Tax=Sphaerisporangium sp. NPDC005289 TaxID=3155247 RepID=UPI0033BCDE43
MRSSPRWAASAVPAMLLALAVAACGAEPTDAAKGAATSAPTGANAAAGADKKINTGPGQNRVRARKVDSIAAQVPAAIAADGRLAVGHSGQGAPPLGFLADDDTTYIGVETDIAQLVADVLGLEVKQEITSWENLFVGAKSGKLEVVFNNVTVTEERKDIYDFATYRVDQLAWQVPKSSPITSITKPADIAGLRVSVGSGTNQEKILLDWDAQNKAAGLKPAEIQYYTAYGDALLALKSGRIQAYFGPNPSIAYNVTVSGDSRIAGTASGAGPDLQGLIAAMTKKDNGLVKPLNEALNTVIKDGKYKEVLDRWGLGNEAIPESQINPPGLPRQSS